MAIKNICKKKINLKKNFSKVRYTIDTLDDFNLFTLIINKILKKNIFSANMEEIVRILLKSRKETLYQKKLDRTFGWKPSFRKDELYRKKLK